MRSLLVCVMLLGSFAAGAATPVRFNGFALLRASSPTGAPFEDDAASSRLEIGADWQPSVQFRAHAHLLARDDPQGASRGSVGVVQAFVDGSVPVGEKDRVRIMAGAFFLPGSRENVDALWESPYSITPSALNSWFGEEFRPIGVDVSYTARRTFTVGATAFRGNDTFGAYLADRGWAMRDHLALLGEHSPTNGEYFTSVSAENDGRVGWAARAAWTTNISTVQLTHIDNRADGIEYPGHLLNWATTFDMVGFDVTKNDWTIAGEAGWGETSVNFGGMFFPTDIYAGYLLISKRIRDMRFTLRAEDFDAAVDDRALTLAFLWSPARALRTGVELSRSSDRARGLVEVRYYFGH